MSANEELYGRIVNAVPEGIWVVSPEGQTIFGNERMAEILGTDVESLQKISCLDPVFPDDLEEAQRELGIQMAGGGRPFDFRLRRIDGSAIWVRISCMPMYDDGGVCTGLLGLFTDISERKRHESALRESEELFRAITTQAAVGITQADASGKWLFLNDRFCEIVGYTRAELQGKTVFDITHADDRETCVVAVNRLLAGEIPSYSAEKRCIRKDGAVIWVRMSVSLVRDAEKRLQYFIGVVEDITAKVHTENALRATEQRLTFAQNAARLGVWDCDLRTNITVISPEYARLHGLESGHPTLTHEEWMELVHPADRERVQILLRESLNQTHVWDTEFRVLWPDGSVHWLLGKGKVFLDDSGLPVRMAGVNLDITERKRAEAALRESEERLRFAQQVASIGTFDWDIETGVSTWTPELEAIYGLPRGGFPGTQSAWEDMVHPDDRVLAVQRVKEALETGTPAEAEWRIILPDGRVRWLLGRWQVFKNAAGKPLRMMGVNMDVTNRKYIEDALRQSEERFRLAVHATNDAVWDIDLVTGTVSWNETYATLYGRPSETSKSWQWWIDRIHPEDRERTSGGLRAAISGSESNWTCEYRFQRVDGAWAYLYDRAYIARDPSGSAWRVIGAMQDLTQRKRAEAELRESEERFRDIADSAPVMVWVCDSDGAVTFTNHFGLNFCGRTMEQIRGMGWSDLLHPDDSARVASEFSSATASRHKYHTSFRLRRADGEYRWVLINGAPRFAGDVYTGYIGITTDITELKRSHEELQAAQKLESLGVLAGGIAHDFNNLLGGILAEAELVEKDLEIGSESREEIQRIKTSAIRGSEIVRELMIYAGENQKNLSETVDVSRLVEEMLKLLKVSISKQVALRTDFRGDFPTVWGNASRIRQVVMNLVLNASEAIGDTEGVITVTAAEVSGGRDLAPNSATDLTPGDYVRIEISDTGCGMTEEIKAKIFDPFYSTKFPGRGLGLAVVQGIVRELGGGINIVSAPGQGTVFQVLLPGAPKRASEIHSTITFGGPGKSNAQTGTILVVEDEETLRRAVSKDLLKRGFSVIEASDGSVALDLIHAHKDEIDVVLLDVTLPGASSREVLEEVLRIRPNLKVIVTSAHDEEMVDAYYSGLRVKHFIRKPFHLDDLVRLFGSVLSAKAP